MKRLLIIGASRGIGFQTTRRALAEGYTVRAFARSANRIPLDHAALEPVGGDALDPQAVTAALSDVDAVIQTLGVPFNWRLLTGPISLFSEATRVLLDAMTASDCKRLLSVTGFGAGECADRIHPLQRPGFALVFGRAYADKTRQEEMIVASGLRWTIARPGVLINGAASGRYRVLREPDTWRNGVISRADVADFLVTQCESEEYVGAAPVLIRW